MIKHITNKWLIYHLLNFLMFIIILWFLSLTNNNNTLKIIMLCYYAIAEFAFLYTKHCPFYLIAKFLIKKPNCNIFTYWRKGYGKRWVSSTIIYLGFLLFIFVLIIKLI